MTERAEPGAFAAADDAEATAWTQAGNTCRGASDEAQRASRRRAADEAAVEAFARPSVRRIVPAAAADPLPVLTRLGAPVSVFTPAPVTWRRPAKLDQAPPADSPWSTRIEREHGVVRLRRVRVEETAEWQRREEARRARQRPPRPPKGARMRKSKKLRALIGDHDWDE